MEVNEINVFNIDNSATKSLDVNNAFTSDELICDEVNSCTSTYSLNKRIKNTSKKAGLVLTLSVSVFTGTISFSNSILGADPVINNFNDSYSIDSTSFSYRFDIKIEKSILKMNIYFAESIVYSCEFKESGTYNKVVNLSRFGDYNVKFYSTNLFDYEKELSQYSFAFTIKNQEENLHE